MKKYLRLSVSAVVVLACLVMFCSCQSTKPLLYGQTTCKIKVTKDEVGPCYSVSGKLLKEDYCSDQDQAQKDIDRITFPPVHINLNQWGESSMGKASDKVIFETSACAGGELIKITHKPGVVLKVKLTGKDKSTVQVSGVMLQTSFEGNKPVVHAYPINNVDCKLNSEVCFYSQKIVNPEALTNEQVEKLADLIAEDICQTDYTKSEWIALDDINNNPQRLNAAVLKRLKKKYQVFNTKNDIPKKFIASNSPGNYALSKYIGGFILKYKITFSSADTITVAYEKCIDHLRAEEEMTKYKWNGKEWEMIQISKTSVVQYY